MSKEKVVLITGGAGFICTNIAEVLMDEGYKVVLMSRSDMHPDDWAEISAKGEIVMVKGDVTQEEEIYNAVIEHGINYLVHGAALTPDLEYERMYAKSVAEVNYMGTINALEVARKTGIKRLVYLGSISAFGPQQEKLKTLIEGETFADPRTMYNISKFAAERTVMHYRDLFGMSCVVARIGDAYGPWEHYTGGRPRMSFNFQTTALAMEGKEVILPMDVERNWIYSVDIAKAVAGLLSAKVLNYDIYPLCGKNPQWPISKWCELIRKRYLNFNYSIDRTKNNVVAMFVDKVDRYAHMDPTRLIEDGIYVPQYDLEKSFDAYMAWIDAHPGYMTRNN